MQRQANNALQCGFKSHLFSLERTNMLDPNEKTTLESTISKLMQAADEIERLRKELQESEDLLDEYRRIETDRNRWEDINGQC